MIKQNLIGLCISLLFLGLYSSYAQQDPQYTQYMYNMNVMNPAYAGSRGNLSIGLLGRTQWVGIDGAPNTGTISIHSPVGRLTGLGLSVIYDEIGPVTEANAYADFSYTIPTSEEGRLAFGVKAGATMHDVSLTRLTPNQSGDPSLVEDISGIYPNVGAGAYYYTDKYYIGLSVPNMLETKHIEESNGIVNSKASERMHYFGTLGYVYQVNEKLKLKPSLMAKAAVGAPLSLDFSLNALLREKIELGVSYRLDDSVSGLIGFNATPKFRIGYAYDYTLTNLGEFNSGSHEIMLLYDFLDDTKILKSPRFF